MRVGNTPMRTVELHNDGALHLIDQPQLPFRFVVKITHRWEATAAAISDMTVRGAGAIGATGAAGLAQAAVFASESTFYDEIEAAAVGLGKTRPTAQNLFVGIAHVQAAIRRAPSIPEARHAAVAAAQAFADADAAACEAIGRHGLTLFREGSRVATHCNAGWLAFVDWGSALSPIYAAHRAGISLSVWVDETRPRGQGARLTAWELAQEGVPHTVIADVTLGSLMARGLVDLMIVGSDRIAANGDVANKIGTYSAAVLAKAHGVPFYVAAPTTTIDPHCPNGASIPIEERDAAEVTSVGGLDEEDIWREIRVVNPDSEAYNPAFDVTPAKYVTGILTERGLIPASPDGIASVLL